MEAFSNTIYTSNKKGKGGNESKRRRESYAGKRAMNYVTNNFFFVAADGKAFNKFYLG